MKIKAAHYGNLDNNLLLVPVYHLNQNLTVPKEVRNRKQKMTIIRGFYDEDVLTYHLPVNFKPDYITEPIKLHNEFGSFVTAMQISEGKLIYSRKLLIKEGEFAPEAYEKFHGFMKKVVDADSQKFVLVKQ
ncbi:MAG: hypothetical protein JWQ14_253 [Adhaeribacter sp.]|jgi:hypothetical protein|nr:hypothetical protein [Adhaeribacter sp.]